MRRATYIRLCAAVLVTTLALGTSVLPLATPLSPQSAAAQGAGLQVSKSVRDVTTGGASAPLGTNITANPGDLLQYVIGVTNPVGGPSAAVGIVVSDTLQPGQAYGPTATCNPTCSFSGSSGSTIFFNIPMLTAGNTVQASFNAYVLPEAAGQIVTNTASATASGMAGPFTSQQTAVAVTGAFIVPGGFCGFSPCGTFCGFNACSGPCGFNACRTSCGLSPCGTTCGFNPCGTCANPCGTTCGFNPCATTCVSPCGTGCINPCGTTCGFNPCGTACGFTTCGTTCSFTCPAQPACPSFCTPATCGVSCVPTTCTTANCFTIGSGTFVLCGTPTGFVPATNTPGLLTMNGMQIALMPFIVPSGQVVVGQPACFTVLMNGNLAATSLQVSPNLPGLNCGCSFSVNGVPSCFLLSPAGSVQGSLSAVPIAAKPLEDPTTLHRVGTAYML